MQLLQRLSYHLCLYAFLRLHSLFHSCLSYIQPYFSDHFAYKTISPTEPLAIAATAFSNAASVYHPSKLYPSFVGTGNVIVSVSIVYDTGAFSAFIPPLSSYVILYSFIDHCAINVIAPLISFGTVYVSFCVPYL